MRSTSVTSASASQHSSTWSLVSAGEDVGRLGHEVDAAEDDGGRLVVVGGESGELERVTPGVGPLDDFVALVVVPEDEELRSERGLGRADPRVELVGGRQGVTVRQLGLESQHRLNALSDGSGLAGGDSLVAHRGVVGPGADLWPEYQAGLQGA